VPRLREYPEYYGRASVGLDALGDYDVVVVATDHDDVDYGKVAEQARLVVDTRNAVPHGPKVYRS
jgi:UDP-N-acetyl-D-glucosamine dehydrogenase